MRSWQAGEKGEEDSRCLPISILKFSRVLNRGCKGKEVKEPWLFRNY